MAFQIRATAAFRFSNFLTGLRSAPNPGDASKRVPNVYQALGRPARGQLRQFLRTGERLPASDYGISLVRVDECGDVVVSVNRKRRHSFVSCAGNPRQDMDHSYPLEKQGNSDLNRYEVKGWRWSAPVAAN
jgi:hypothetical protein